MVCRTTLIQESFATLGVLLVSVQMALACACCVEPGHRKTFSYDLGAYDIEKLSHLVQNGQGRLYSDVCADECIKGINVPNEKVDINFEVLGKLLQITINKGQTSQTTLRSPLPQKAQYFAVDTKPSAANRASHMYSEIRLKLQLTGDGSDWHTNNKPVPAQLILMGQGNACPSITNVQDWVLDVGGMDEPAWFKLFGKPSRSE